LGDFGRLNASREADFSSLSHSAVGEYDPGRLPPQTDIHANAARFRRFIASAKFGGAQTRTTATPGHIVERAFALPPPPAANPHVGPGGDIARRPGTARGAAIELRHPLRYEGGSTAATAGLAGALIGDIHGAPGCALACGVAADRTAVETTL